MATKLEEIAKAAKLKQNIKFTSLMHLVDYEMLRLCHQQMPTGKATGVDKVTKEEYQENLTENLHILLNKMKEFSYKPQPVRRTYIEKVGSNKKRPLGIPAYEDKIVQLALAEILTAIYEQEFLDVSCGYRPKKKADMMQLRN